MTLVTRGKKKPTSVFISLSNTSESITTLHNVHAKAILAVSFMQLQTLTHLRL